MSIPVSTQIASGASQKAPPKVNPLLETGKDSAGNAVGEDHFSFKDLLDIVNPLQHIPIVNNIYRKITGDEISNVSRIAGDALYGGFIGAAFGMANAVAVNETGQDMGGVALTKMGLLKSQETAQNDKTKVDGDTSTNIDTKGLQVVEIHPSDKADKNGITWDQPKDVSSAQSSSQPTAPSLAMPSAKDLNDIAPGGPDIDPKASDDKTAAKSADPSVSKADIQKNMLDGLNKYDALQKDANPGLIVPKAGAQTAAAATPAITPNAVVADASNVIAPKNIFAVPASAPTTSAAASIANPEVQNAAVKKPTAAFNKLRHFSN